eukprot:gene12864-14189_t
MDSDSSKSEEVLPSATENLSVSNESSIAPTMSNVSQILVDSGIHNQFILLPKTPATVPGTQISQSAVQQASISLSQAFKGQNIRIIQPHLLQKARPAGSKPVISLNRSGGFIPVQASQGQTILLNSIAQHTASAAKCPILPKGASPEKSTVQAGVNKQVLLPVSLASAINPSTTLTVRPIPPGLAAAILQGSEADKKSVPRIQTTFPPRAIAPQPQPMIFPTQGGAPVVLRPTSLNTSSIKTLSNNVLRIQGPSGQMMQAVITTPVHVQGSNAQEAVIVNNQSKASRGEDEPINGSDIAVETKPVKKPCNCTKSQCLKLYCDCFANGEFCNNCNCHNCSNNIQHEAERSKAIKSCLERNPSAFHPKIGKAKAKIMCSALCKCTGCKNFEESPERKTLMHLADAAEVRVLQQNAARSKLESQLEAATSKSISTNSETRLPFTFITSPVVNATCECLMATAEECELVSTLISFAALKITYVCIFQNNIPDDKAERMLLDEFGRSLLQIIQTANKSKGAYIDDKNFNWLTEDFGLASESAGFSYGEIGALQYLISVLLPTDFVIVDIVICL